MLPNAPEGPILVDSGFWTHRNQLVLTIQACGVSPRDLRAIVLTHRHLDHAGNAQWLQDRYGVPVYAHKNDAALLRGDQKAPPLPERVDFAGALSRLENHFPARIPEVIPLEEGEVVGGLEVISMPGHTRGSVFLYHRDSATLFSGDTILNAIPPVVQRVGLSLPHEAFCEDYRASLDSLRRFLKMDLEVRRLCPGHGPARRGGVAEELARLLSHVP